MSVKINQIPGQMPPFWDRSVVFFANILSLFYGNVPETQILKNEVGALETYGSRLLPLINLMFHGEDNILILEVAPDSQLIEYFTSDLGLTLPKIHVFTDQTYQQFSEAKSSYCSKACELIDLLSGCRAKWLDGYVVDESLVRLAQLTGKQTIGSKEGSRCGNNKVLLHRYLKTTSLDAFDSFEADSPKSILRVFQELKAKGYKYAVVKAPIGASGVGMIKMALDVTPADFKIPEYIFFEGDVLIQGWLDDSVSGVRYIASPSVQLFIDDEQIHLYDLTDQILSEDSIHEGNVAPPPFLDDMNGCRDELFRQAEKAGGWLYALGYRGTGSIDFHVIERDNRIEIRICEINARVTGATYPAVLARTFYPHGAWLMRNIRFEPSNDTSHLLANLDEAGLLYRPGNKTGILPFNFNPNAAGEIIKGQFLFLAPSVNDINSLLKNMQEIETIKGVYDRD